MLEQMPAAQHAGMILRRIPPGNAVDCRGGQVISCEQPQRSLAYRGCSMPAEKCSQCSARGVCMIGTEGIQIVDTQSRSAITRLGQKQDRGEKRRLASVLGITATRFGHGISNLLGVAQRGGTLWARLKIGQCVVALQPLRFEIAAESHGKLKDRLFGCIGHFRNLISQK